MLYLNDLICRCFNECLFFRIIFLFYLITQFFCFFLWKVHLSLRKMFEDYMQQFISLTDHSRLGMEKNCKKQVFERLPQRFKSTFFEIFLNGRKRQKIQKNVEDWAFFVFQTTVSLYKKYAWCTWRKCKSSNNDAIVYLILSVEKRSNLSVYNFNFLEGA